jgi:hypothetical protein
MKQGVTRKQKANEQNRTEPTPPCSLTLLTETEETLDGAYTVRS